MVGSNKILTVSYGTFSCTLEGFEDSFGTMKAIAEYFRDLAADDRYFGAEPPVPDVQMLARIAEREVERRVEARMDASGITLRTGDALPEQVAAAMPQPAPAIQVQDISHLQTTPLAATAVVDGDIAGSEAEVFGDDTSALLAASDPVMAKAPVPVAAKAPVMPPVVLAPVQVIRPVPVRAAAPSVVTMPAVVPAHPDADSVAAKLQRIRAVVGRGTIGLAAQEFAEDLADTGTTTESAMPAMADSSADSVWSELDANEARDTIKATDDWSENLAFPDNVEDANAPEPTMPDAPAFDMNAVSAALAKDTSDPDAEPVLVSPVRARVIRMRRAEFDQAVSDGALQDIDSPAEMADEATGLDDLQDLEDLAALDGHFENEAGEAFGTLSDEDEAELLRELAEVERETSANLTSDDAVSSDLDAPKDESLALDLSGILAAAAAATETAPSDDQDMEALFETSGVYDDADIDFAEIADENAAADSDATVAPSLARPGRALLGREPEADEAAMERILSQTDAELNDPDTSRRREAISQLKAAVAATEAARRLGDVDTVEVTDEVENAFRDDLKQVVRPRRPVAEAAADLRSERPKPAPLKLVASQRIDIPAPRPAPIGAMPVRPRRVSVDPDQVAAVPDVAMARRKAGSFAEFAESMGAKQLPDLLEAAAAYTSFVEGVEDFSRPQLMNKVRDMVPEEFSREDGLRSFGTLLRQGRIMKTRNGRFQVSEESRFNPERRAG